MLPISSFVIVKVSLCRKFDNVSKLELENAYKSLKNYDPYLTKKVFNSTTISPIRYLFSSVTHESFYLKNWVTYLQKLWKRLGINLG